MKQGVSYSSAAKAAMVVSVPALEQPTETKNVDHTHMKATGINNGNSAQRDGPKEGLTKPPIAQNSPTSQSMHIQGTVPALQNIVLPTASSWDGLNGRDPSSPPALPKDFVFAQPQALPPRDGPRK